MNRFIYFLFFSIFFLDYLDMNFRMFPRSLTWMPEMLSLVTMIFVALLVCIKRSFFMRKAYILVFFYFFWVIIVGILANTVPPGALFSGLRNHLKSMILFFLPAAYVFSESQFRSQLKLLLILSLIQCPFALYQRLIKYRDLATGDVITGTLNGSGVLTIYLSCSLAIVLAFYFSKKLNLKLFLFILIVLFIPMCINETKVTLLLIPSVCFSMFFFTKGLTTKFKQIFAIPAISIALILLFIPIYDHFRKTTLGHSSGIIDFITTEEKVKNYLLWRPKGRENRAEVGRLTSIVLAYQELSQDPVKLIFGLGLGNVAISFFAGFQGEYVKYEKLGARRTALTFLLWEIGLAGVFLYLAFLYLIFKDALYLKTRRNIIGSFSLGRIVVVVIVIPVSFIYLNFITRNVLAYLFWYFSGFIAAKRFEYES